MMRGSVFAQGGQATSLRVRPTARGWARSRCVRSSGWGGLAARVPIRPAPSWRSPAASIIGPEPRNASQGSLLPRRRHRYGRRSPLSLARDAMVPQRPERTVASLESTSGRALLLARRRYGPSSARTPAFGSVGVRGSRRPHCGSVFDRPPRRRLGCLCRDGAADGGSGLFPLAASKVAVWPLDLPRVFPLEPSGYRRFRIMPAGCSADNKRDRPVSQ
jgi:hypothetical protein